MALERACKLGQGDVLVELIDRHDMRAIDIARITGRRPNDLSQLYNTAKMFSPPVRRPEVPYNGYFLAMRMSRKFRTSRLEPMAVLEQILARGLTQHRDVTRYFAQRAQAARVRLLPDRPWSGGFTLNQSYHSRFQDLRRSFGNGAIKILSIDPPYVYARSEQGRYRSRSVRSLDCDNSARVAALTTVTDLLREWQPTLSPGGVLLLWQPAEVLLREIADAIEEYKWGVESLVVWDKGRPQPGALDSPYSPQDEHLLVLKRQGETLLNHDNSNRGNILRFAPVSRPGLADAQEHGFEKPVDLCKFLIGKHSFERELVVDLCGCTGAMSMAAIETDRQWVYVESNLSNYQIGAGRLAERSQCDRAEAS